MPRCYMVKKANKHQTSNETDLWDQKRENDSPIEGAVAPRSYTALTNRPVQPNDETTYTGTGAPVLPTSSKTRTKPPPEGPSEGLPSGSPPPFPPRSAEETEAAHDLLSLSQSLPPLTAPGVVMIHHSVPNEDREPSSPTMCYKIGQAAKQKIEVKPVAQERHQQRDPVIVENTTIHNFTLVQGPQIDNVLYLVQMPPERVNHLHVQAMPTPPGSDCSSDVDQVALQDQPSSSSMSIDESTDVIVLPLSPEASDSHPGPSSGSASPHPASVRAVEMITFEQQYKQKTVWRPLDEMPKKKEAETSSEKDASSSALLMDLPDRRRRKRTAKKGAQKRSPSTKTKFYKVVDDEIEEEEEEEPMECDQKTKFSCNECGKCYATSSNLSRHKQTHRSLDSHSAKKCNTCGKAYVSMPALAMHLLTHKLAHSCDICGKMFSRPWLLQGHLRSHNGEKPYGCGHCGKAFADRSNLRAHMQTHSDEKRFECPNCTKSFALKSYLNKHMESTCMSYPGKSKEVRLREARKNAETQTVTGEDSNFSIVVD